MFTFLICLGCLCVIGFLLLCPVLFFGKPSDYEGLAIMSAAFLISGAICAFVTATTLGPQCTEKKNVEGEWVCSKYEKAQECLTKALDQRTRSWKCTEFKE